MAPTDPDQPFESQKQKRRHARTKIAVEAELHLETARTPLRVKTADLSLGGLYVEMVFTLEIGTKLKLVVRLNDVKVITGGVVRTRDLQRGNGIEFTDMAHEDHAKLKRFLATAQDKTSAT
jgi:c-di-GMP-binding flagellar brake protein YcgR